MNKDERHAFILEKLVTDQKVFVIHLAKLLKVTPETIRRDLAELEMNEQLSQDPWRRGSLFFQHKPKWFMKRKCPCVF